MMNSPLFEHDYENEAKVEPSRVIKPRDVSEHCVISFFRETNQKIVREMDAKIAISNRWEDGEHNIYEIDHKGKRLAFFQPGVGAAIGAGLLEEAIAFGCKKFIVCGGCGVLKRDLFVGKLIVVDSAVRDEGTSYHYLPPAREVQTDPKIVGVIEESLSNKGIPFITGKTWTTDAPYRETQAIIQVREAEGCFTVEMEAAAFLAVAQYRKVQLGQILYAGDDMSGEQWDNRSWQSRADIRENLFWLAADICLSL